MNRDNATAGARLLSEEERHFIETRRFAHLATADCHAIPHVMPVCFAFTEGTIYITIDEKPKNASGTGSSKRCGSTGSRSSVCA